MEKNIGFKGTIQFLRHKVLFVFTNCMFLIICGLLLTLPLFLYRFGIYSSIVPAFEIIISYYITIRYRPWILWLIPFGILCDQLYSMPLGTNTLAFTAGYILFRLLTKYAAFADYMRNIYTFSAFTGAIYLIRYLIFYHKNTFAPSVPSVFVQYLITISTYPILELFLNWTAYKLTHTIDQQSLSKLDS